MIEVDEYILLYAFRYALGRQTSAAYDVVLDLVKNRDKLSTTSKKLIINETIQHLNNIDDERYPADLVGVWNSLIVDLGDENSEKINLL